MAIIVNGELVEDQRFVEMFRQLGDCDIGPGNTGDPYRAEALRQLAERRVVERLLLRQMASAAEFKVSPEEVNARRSERWGTSSASVCGLAVQQQLADDLLVEKYCEWLGRHEPRPSRTEVEQYYMRNRSKFVTPERVQVEQIVCNIDPPATSEEKAHARIVQAEQELISGKLFARVADRFSDCGGKVMLGWVERGAMVQQFEEVVFALPEGGRSGVFRTVFGFHIAKVLQKKQAGLEDLEEIRSVLARRMFEERQRRAVEAATDQALRTARIEAVPEGKAIE